LAQAICFFRAAPLLPPLSSLDAVRCRSMGRKCLSLPQVVFGIGLALFIHRDLQGHGLESSFAVQSAKPQRKSNKRRSVPPQVLTRQLTDAASANHVLFLVENHASSLDEHHIGAALKWLAKEAPSDSQLVLKDDPGFRTLLARTSELLSGLQSQALTNVLWSLAKVDHDPGNVFMQAALKACMRQIACSTPQDLVNSLWACAKLDYQPGPQFLQAVLARSQTTLERFVPMDLANVVWSCAKLQHYPGETFLHQVLLESNAKIARFVAVDINNIFWGCAKLGYRPKALLQPLLLAAEQQLEHFDSQQLASLLWSCTVLGLRPTPALLRALPSKRKTQLISLGPRGLSFVLWLYATLGHHPGADFIALVLDKLSRSIPAFGFCGPEGLSGVLWACAKFEHQPGQSHMTGLLASAQTTLPESSASQLAQVLWACTRLGHQPDRSFLADWLQQAAAQEESFQRHELQTCLSASIQLNFEDGVSMMEAMLRRERIPSSKSTV